MDDWYFIQVHFKNLRVKRDDNTFISLTSNRIRHKVMAKSKKITIEGKEINIISSENQND